MYLFACVPPHKGTHIHKTESQVHYLEILFDTARLCSLNIPNCPLTKESIMDSSWKHSQDPSLPPSHQATPPAPLPSCVNQPARRLSPSLQHLHAGRLWIPSICHSELPLLWASAVRVTKDFSLCFPDPHTLLFLLWSFSRSPGLSGRKSSRAIQSPTSLLHELPNWCTPTLVLANNVQFSAIWGNVGLL